MPGSTPAVTVVMCTYNRGPLLAAAIRSVLEQRDASTPPFELIVVDNNSTDDTRRIVEAFAAADRRVRYGFEPRQGLSFARNAGLRDARAALVAFTDDDVRVERDWVAAIVRTFDEHPEAALAGGRVLPLWPSSPPAWLTKEHWAPLALVDHGGNAIAITREHQICPVGANLVCRREVFDVVGLFTTGLQRVKEGIGSLEDHEFLLRVLRTGRTGVYDPRIVVHAEIQADRLTVAYHRRWHTGHGHFHALLRSEQVERSGRGTLAGVPAHLFRQAAADAIGWIRARAAGSAARAIHYEMRLRFFVGFVRTRIREWFASRRPSSATAGEPLLQRADAAAGRGHE